ncbi:hypothetical protein [Dokdonella sp.]|uniref:DUF7933 domain-containing protein n=1 Tax=Dokdonella sp. TaxID=2291710 RepID=UPI00262B7DD5|nr:hypothetical protein [Dokdonella sp.]
MKPTALFLGGALALAGWAQAATLESGPGTAAAMPVAAAPLGATAIAQMSDHTPAAMGGASCSDAELGITRGNSWWRRFYLDEHGVSSSLTIDSVTVGVETGSTPVTIRLHALAHDAPAETIPLDRLRLVGTSGLVTVGGTLQTVTIPVTGTIADTAAEDLVVEFHTDGNTAQAFYAGGNASAQTHEAFISASACGIPEPAPMSAVGFPNAHMILFANAATPAIGVVQDFAPAIVIGEAPSRLSITLLNPLPAPAALLADFVDDLPAGLKVAATPNAATDCGGTLTAQAGTSVLSLGAAGATIPALGRCTIAVDVAAAAGGNYTNRIGVGALRTGQGDNAVAAEATLVVVPAGGNGVIDSGPLHHALVPTLAGTSFNLVSGEFNDLGTLDPAHFDLNLAVSLNDSALAALTLNFRPVAPARLQILVDGADRARALRDGDVVGPGGSFSSLEVVQSDIDWLVGTEAALGVRFACGGRLTYPVAGGYCYGYVRIATAGTSGYAARLLDARFDGDGNAITVVLPAAQAEPSASIAPLSLTFRLAPGEIGTQSLALSNAAGSRPLQHALAAQGETVPAIVSPRSRRSGTTAAVPLAPLRPRPQAASPSPLVSRDVSGSASAPWQTPGGLALALDDGSYENIIGFGEVPGIWLNRFHVFAPTTINSVSVLWPQQYEEGSLAGLQANLVAYYDEDGDGDPSNAVRLGIDEIVAIEHLDRFENYPTQFQVPGPGDVYVGFVEHWPMQEQPLPLSAVAIDMDSFFGDSYLSVNLPADPPVPLDLDHLGQNDFSGTLATLVGGYLGGNWLIRASATIDGCDGAPVPWLSAKAPADAVRGGGTAPIVVQADASADGLAPGEHSAQLCLATDDPAHPLIVVPVRLTVAAPSSCAGDSLFCDGFDGTAAIDADLVESGPLRLDVPRDVYGLSFNFARGEWSPASFFGDDFAVYWNDMSRRVEFHWFDEHVAGANAGVASRPSGPLRSLRSGDVVGPDSLFSNLAGEGEAAELVADGERILGLRFFNEETRQTNYGYVRLMATWPGAFPLTIVGYAYNKSGAPIVVP